MTRPHPSHQRSAERRACTISARFVGSRKTIQRTPTVITICSVVSVAFLIGVLAGAKLGNALSPDDASRGRIGPGTARNGSPGGLGPHDAQLPNVVFHWVWAVMISSRVRRGLISKTRSVSFGINGINRSNSTLPVKG